MSKIATTQWIGLALIGLMLASCAAKKPYYAKDYANWQQLDKKESAGEVVFTYFLIGDAGKASLKEQEPSLKLLQQYLQEATDQSAVVYLGDNVYTYGLPPADHPNRAHSEDLLNEQLKILDGYDGQVFFVPGNHDWYAKEVQPYALAEEEAYIENYLSNENVFIPEGGSQGPHLVQLSENQVLIAIDSYRWIRDLEQKERRGEITPLDSLPNFTMELAEYLLANTDKQVLIVDHHPMFTNGGHGGFYSWKDHFFPLRVLNKKLWIPLPVLGSILPLARKLGLSKEDKTNKHYKRFVTKIMELTRGYNNVIFASGHEHSLQYHFEENHPFIVSGAGSKSSYLRKGHGMKFGHITKGFTTLEVLTDGSTWATYIEPVADGSEGKVVFTWQVSGKTQP